MTKFLVGLLLLPIFSLTALQSVSGYFIDEVAKGDKFIDQFLQDMLHEHGHEYDPYNLEDGVVAFWKKVLFVNVSGEAKLFEGYINGLKTLHRSDHCSINEKDNRRHISAYLGAGVLNCHYKGTAKFMNWGPTIIIIGEIAYLEALMAFSIDAKTGRDGVLEKFNIDGDIKGMTVKITGLGPLNWAANHLISGVTSVFKGFVRRMFEKQVKGHIEERLPNYQFPVND